MRSEFVVVVSEVMAMLMGGYGVNSNDPQKIQNWAQKKTEIGPRVSFTGVRVSEEVGERHLSVQSRVWASGM